MKIYKYPIEVAGMQKIVMPQDGRIISAQFQNDILCLWAIVENLHKVKERTIFIYGTGEPLNTSAVRYIATLQQAEFVWHIFEERP